MAARVVLDARAATGSRNGIWRFTAGLLDGLRQYAYPVQPWAEVASDNFEMMRVAPYGTWARSFASLGPCIFHNPANGTSLTWIDALPESCGVVLTLHDVIPITVGGEVEGGAYRTLLEKVIRRADAVATVSRASRSEICSHLGLPEESVRVIYPGVQRFAAESKPEAFDRLEWLDLCPDCRYMVCVGGLERWYKNANRVFEAAGVAIRELGGLWQVVFVGYMPAHLSAKKFLEAVRLGMGDRVVFAGRVTDVDLGHLYHTADVVIHASRAEGFGQPPLEGALCGAPVVVSDLPVFRELLGNAPWYADPSDSAALSGAIVDALRCDYRGSRRQEDAMERVSKLSWNACASGYRDLYEEIAGVRLTRLAAQP